MSLPTPNLDDRSFQQLVDEAKLHLQRRCPEWSNHNVSDPGVALIEAFAWMTEQLIYRCNRVPDRNYVKFLELMGITLFPPVAARVEVSFRLSSHQSVPVLIAAGTTVATRRTAIEPSVEFATTTDLEIPPASSTRILTNAGGDFTDRSEELAQRRAFETFSSQPLVGDALYVGLDQPAPSCIVLVQFICQIAGHGIDPNRPPLRWEAWTLDGWVECQVEKDTTLGLNAPGGVEIHVPRGHAESSIADLPAAWLRCRVVELAGVRPYRSSPRIVSVSGATVGGDVESRNSIPVTEDALGVSDGTPGQRFRVRRPPIIKDDGPLVLQIGTLAGASEEHPPAAMAADGSLAPGLLSDVPLLWEEWIEVESFANSEAQSRHFIVDHTSGEITFGPVVRASDGSRVQHGGVPEQTAVIRIPAYRTGGGAAGNVTRGAVNVLRSSIPYVATVYNRTEAIGGVDGETVDEAKTRGPVALRSRNRAVTAEDFEELTKQAASELVRVKCVPSDDGVRILVIPRVVDDVHRMISLGALRPPDSARESVLRELETCRMVGVRVSVEPPSYVGVRVDARVHCDANVDADRLRRDCTEALFAYFNPVVGGPDGTGWPFGRPAQVGEVYAVLGGVRGVDYVEDAAIFRANPITQEVSERQERIDLEPTHLLMSVEHQVDVLRR